VGVSAEHYAPVREGIAVYAVVDCGGDCVETWGGLGELGF
jgi:hypothetical protein